ncbi:MAG: DUF484 family protein [Halorhodospira halophila]|uniref:DUF484 family protein n=1 Tax=Halorhodospira TaxID=85108 RepID=UPI001913D21E|nr:DUF484 family protein [Halorhodospira halophila]MCG5532284.1 DUF484 family protein [Halorhodospira sp. 9621]MCG5541316.1 DUF484 family protein [Halorhodospira sp. M39old]MCG5546534.1 DUF484 family protein [Halorhodospira sp. M38]MBK5943556.1 hypothetical protein [Halorhodospira halophila]MCC3750139.1 DUF484 family protein [Halorhodospira halophila]
MTESAKREEAPLLDEAEVAAYLVEHPDLLHRHPEVLARLELRHDCGDATSLIEHQVRVLREESAGLRRRLDDMVRVARQNEGTAERLHELTLDLFAADDLQAAVEALRAGLREGFQADAVGLLLIAPEQGSAAAREPLPELLGDGDPTLTCFRPLLERGRPSCGAPTDAQARTIFPDTETTVASAALVPMIDERAVGVLGIGSSDPQRYHPGQGTVFLRRLGTTAARVFDRLLHRG